MIVAGFDWDRGNRTKCQKHGVTIAEIESLFEREIRVEPDPSHSQREERFKAIGTTSAGRHVFIAFTLRQREGRMLIRPISARFMHAKEVKQFEEETAKAED